MLVSEIFWTLAHCDVAHLVLPYLLVYLHSNIQNGSRLCKPSPSTDFTNQELIFGLYMCVRACVLCMYVCMCVCVYVCMYVCVFLQVSIFGLETDFCVKWLIIIWTIHTQLKNIFACIQSVSMSWNESCRISLKRTDFVLRSTNKSTKYFLTFFFILTNSNMLRIPSTINRELFVFSGYCSLTMVLGIKTYWSYRK